MVDRWAALRARGITCNQVCTVCAVWSYIWMHAAAKRHASCAASHRHGPSACVAEHTLTRAHLEGVHFAGLVGGEAA